MQDLKLLTKDEITVRLIEIDAMFDRAPNWGSWMISVANEREALVNDGNRRLGMGIEHKHLARTGSGKATD